MRNRPLSTILACVLCLGALALGACGGDDSTRQETTWRASDRLPVYTAHWWWEPTERSCEEDSHCETGERCRRMRLGTCPGCPPGENARVCVDSEGNTRRAASRGRAGAGAAAQTKAGGTASTSTTSTTR